jgi:hypothetical protein
MQLLFDEDLVEAVVFLCARGRRPGAPPLLVRRFHAERERLYSILDPDERNAAFFTLHLAWFREWGVERFLQDVVHAFPLLADSLQALAFRKARSKSEEGAELYVNPDGQRHGLLALRPEQFERSEPLMRFLHHELQHLTDMVDPSFGYSPDLSLSGQTVSQQRLVRQRYRLLWDVTIDSRLTRSGRATTGTRQQRWVEFDSAFSFLAEPNRAETFDALWSGANPRHAGLLALASDPRGAGHSRGPLPGGPCPLCGFPTFHWAEPAALTPEIHQRILREFPAWTARDGLCHRCAETYEAAFQFAPPPTVFM